MWTDRLRRLGLLALFALAALLPAPAPAQHGPQRSAEEWARIYNDPGRAAWQKPEEVLRALELKPQDVVADIGAGAGYFAVRFAPYVAKVYAVDINADLLQFTARHAPGNVQTVLAAPDDAKLPDASVDVAFFCDVIHHIGGRPEYLRRLARALRPGGRVVIIDFYKKPLPVGPPVEVKLTAEEVTAELRAAGFRLARQFDFLPYQYFLVFKRE
jgi:ubiquinone/menaquinone biosynthesis C-methylase UbiE